MILAEKHAEPLLRGGALLLVALVAIVTLAQWLTNVAQPTDLDFAESYHAWCAQQAYPGGEHVSEFSKPPLTVLPYPPGGYLLISGVGRLLGADDVLAFRQVGRVLTLAASVGIALLVAIMARACGARWSLVFVAAGLLLALRPVQLFAYNPRPDALAVALTLLGVWLGLCKRWAIPAAVAIGVAIACKHSFLAAPAVLVLSLLWERRVLMAAVVVAIMLLIGAATMLLANLCLGPFWLQGLTLQSFAGADIKQSIYFIGLVVGSAVVPLGLAGVGLFVAGAPRQVRWLQLYLVLALGLHCVAMVKPGAASNYLLEPVAVALVLAAWLAETYLEEQTPKWRLSAWALVIASGVPLLVIQVDDLLGARRAGRDAIAARQREFAAELAQTPGPILAEESWVYVWSGKPLLNFPPDLTRTAFDTGQLDPAPVTRMLAGGEIDVVVYQAGGHRFLPDVWREQIDAHYTQVDTFDGRAVYRPR